MKITEVKTYNLSYPLVEPFANALSWSKARHAGIVEIRTDAGITGWGEGTSTPSQAAIDTCLIGKDPFDIEVIWNELHQRGRSNTAAISGVDIALWDIVGKVLDQPIYRLLGGAFRKPDSRLCLRAFQKSGARHHPSLDGRGKRLRR